MNEPILNVLEHTPVAPVARVSNKGESVVNNKEPKQEPKQEPTTPTPDIIPYIQNDMSDIWNFITNTLEVQYPPNFGFDYYYLENQMNKTKELWENYFANDFPWYQAYGIAADTIGITTANSIWNTLCNKEHRKNYKNRIARQLELIHRWDAQIPRQRTPAWQERRYNMITASEVHHILGDSENTWKGCLRGKLRGYREFINAQNNPPENTPVTSSASSLDWGVCFEPVVTDIIYPKMRGDCTVGEFGCIEHPHIPGLGASPDGIIVEGPMKYVGRMVEIKCPTSREYDPYKIKYEYWVQMQIQMEVCDLEECDFIECWFKEVEKEAWETEPEDGRTKGIAYRVASPEGSSWFHKKDELPENALITEKRQWILDRISCRLVKRNREWFLSVREQIQEFIDELHSIHKYGDFSIETMEYIDDECREVSGRSKKLKTNDAAHQKLSGFAFRNI